MDVRMRLCVLVLQWRAILQCAGCSIARAYSLSGFCGDSSSSTTVAAVACGSVYERAAECASGARSPP